ncbi:hypothetical protein SSAG_00134 [Streptomyces sp. Mg1]|nr:hypothetical protein SSAG_00134 [Streptomyces sp. Mg1]
MGGVKTSPGCVAPSSTGGTLDMGNTCPTEPREYTLMDAENVVGLIVAVALLAYLVAALIRPERF